MRNNEVSRKRFVTTNECRLDYLGRHSYNILEEAKCTS